MTVNHGVPGSSPGGGASKMIKPLYCYSVAVFLFLHINIPLKTIELKTPIYQAISQMISVSETEFELFMDKSFVRSLC
jgi:hypothetical protein